MVEGQDKSAVMRVIVATVLRLLRPGPVGGALLPTTSRQGEKSNAYDHQTR
jgi:hypothetical protein